MELTITWFTNDNLQSIGPRSHKVYDTWTVNLLDTGRPTPKQENLGHAKNGLARSQLLWWTTLQVFKALCDTNKGLAETL